MRLGFTSILVEPSCDLAGLMTAPPMLDRVLADLAVFYAACRGCL
jgi:hypothetical protein